MKKILKLTRQKLINFILKSNIISEMIWKIKGRPIPPPYSIKQKIIKDYAKNFNIRTFVETGTYLGGTVKSVKNLFDNIYSIELDKILFEKAKNKFINYKHINILEGDSSKILPTILLKIEKPALFWLDGHYSGGNTAKGDLNTPISKELELILNHKIKNHIILIDDARCFNGEDDYPTTKELEIFIKKINPKLDFKIDSDIIRILNLE